MLSVQPPLSQIFSPPTGEINSSLQEGSSRGLLRRPWFAPPKKPPPLHPICLDNFCLVSNLPFLGKMVEKVVAWQFQRVLEETDYLDLFLSGFSIQKLQLVQNAATWAVLGAPRVAHVTPLFCKLHWLPVCSGYNSRHGIRLTEEPSHLIGNGPPMSVEEACCRPPSVKNFRLFRKRDFSATSPRIL